MEDIVQVAIKDKSGLFLRVQEKEIEVPIKIFQTIIVLRYTRPLNKKMQINKVEINPCCQITAIIWKEPSKLLGATISLR